MPRRRYTVLIADRSTGVLRRVTISLRTAVAVVTTVLMMPVLIGLGAKWSARDEIDQLHSTTAALQIENGNFRQTTGELTTQMLPAIIKSRAAGGGTQPNAAISDVLSTSLTSPEDTFGVLRTLLQSLENRLRYVRRDVERTEALAAATPSLWPTYGWLTGYFWGRADPFTGEPANHQDNDISTEKGSPVYATANGTVASAAPS